METIVATAIGGLIAALAGWGVQVQAARSGRREAAQARAWEQRRDAHVVLLKTCWRFLAVWENPAIEDLPSSIGSTFEEITAFNVQLRLSDPAAMVRVYGSTSAVDAADAAVAALVAVGGEAEETWTSVPNEVRLARAAVDRYHAEVRIDLGIDVR